MATTVVRVDRGIHAKLRELADARNQSINQVIDDLIKRDEDARFWTEARVAYGRLRADPVGWTDYQKELNFFDGVVMDGLEDEPPYPYEEDEKRD